MRHADRRRVRAAERAVAGVGPRGSAVNPLLNPMRRPRRGTGLALGALTLGTLTVAAVAVGYTVGHALPLP